jgi:predicted KAP-like P-loop ATPase
MTNPNVQDITIASDAALTDPAHDAFGYAPFAQRIADAVCKTPSPQGLVMAIHGLWGTGKSTLLNFVRYNLDKLQSNEKPVVIDFNPWWFNSREHLAAQFLSQFRAKLPHESEVLRAIGDKMADYGSAIGTVIAGTYGIPWLDKLINFILKFFKRKPQDVPALKTEIANALDKAGQRFVFIIDDIDRLAPDEIRELFKVLKALADFPNVIYLLAFDRQVVSEALHTSLGVEGEAYLEKIVQVQFSLPTVDRLRLRQKLFVDLDHILESFPLRNFDLTYWGNVYYDGLDHYINKPRDIVRIINTLCVTYPAVAGEVNVIDFVALEFLRVFEPDVYGVIRDHRDMFVGASDYGYRQGKETEKAFHDTWLAKVPKNRQSTVKTLLSRLFPKLESIWGNMSYGGDWDTRWRKELRACSPDIFDIYFQFGVSADTLRRTELDELISVAADTEKAIQILKFASTIKRPNGMSKAREYIERIYDFTDEITPEIASGLLNALFNVGDVILSPEDEGGGIIAIPNRWRLFFITNHLLKRIPVSDQKVLLSRLIEQGQAISLVTDIVSTIEDYRSKPEEAHDSPLAQIDEAQFNKFKGIVINRLAGLHEQQLLAIPELALVIHLWIRWAGQEIVSSRIGPIMASDIHLPLLLEKYLSFGTTQGMGDRVARRIPRLNPRHFESLTDITVLEQRVEQMLHRTDLTKNQRTAGEQFLKGMERIRQGKDTDELL